MSNQLNPALLTAAVHPVRPARQWAIPFNSYTSPMDDQLEKFNPWT